MTLIEAIHQAKSAGVTNVSDIIRYLTKRPQTVTEGTAEQAKPQTQHALESALRAILTSLNVPTPIPAGTMLNLLQATPESDEQRDTFTRAIAIRGELVGLHGLTDEDFRADDFGQPTKPVSTRTVTEGDSIAEANGLTVTRETVLAALRGLQ